MKTRFTSSFVIRHSLVRGSVGALRTSLALACAMALCLSVSCTSLLPSNATPQQKAQAAIDTATTSAKFVVGPAVTAWLLLQKDPAKQQQAASFIYAGAAALNSASTGQILTQAELAGIIATFTNPDPRYLEIAQLLSSEYGTLYPLFKIAGTSPVKFFSEISAQAQIAARPFLGPQPYGTPIKGP